MPCSLTLSQAIHELTGKDFLLSSSKADDSKVDAEYSSKMVADIVSDNSTTHDNVIDLIAVKKQALAIEEG